MASILCFFFMFFLLLVDVAKPDFKIFGCGTRKYLGIGMPSTQPQPFPVELFLPDDNYFKNNPNLLLTHFETTASFSTMKIGDRILQWGENEKKSMNADMEEKIFDKPVVTKIHSTAIIKLTENFSFLIDKVGGMISTIGFPYEPAEAIWGFAGASGRTNEASVKIANLSPQISSVRDADSFLVTTSDGKLVEFGFTVSAGEVLMKDYNYFRANTPPYGIMPLKIQGLYDVYQILDKRGFLWTYGQDKTQKVMGYVPEDPYLFGIDSTNSSEPVHYKNQPSKNCFFPSRLRFRVNGVEINRFKNIISGTQASIAITEDNRLLVWGKNPYNMLGVDNYNASLEADKQYVYPPRYATEFPSFDQTRQIVVADTHTLILKNDNTIWGIGSNKFGNLAQEMKYLQSIRLVELRVNPRITQCLNDSSCSIEFIAASLETTFFGVNYGTNQSVQIGPMCFGKSHLDLHVCGERGFCFDNDVCKCFDGYYGKDCSEKYDCSGLPNCNGHGVCVSNSVCECFDHATGPSCSIPKCGTRYASDPDVCSGRGTCVFSNETLGSQCICHSGTGTFCGDGDISPLLFAAGASAVGQTGTGSLEKYVTKFSKVSFANVEVSQTETIKWFEPGFFGNSFVYRNTIYSFGGPRYVQQVFGFGSPTEGIFAVPSPYDPRIFSSSLEKAFVNNQVKCLATGKLAAAVLTNRGLFVLKDEKGTISTTKPYQIEKEKLSDVRRAYSAFNAMYFLTTPGEVHSYGNNKFSELGIFTELETENTIQRVPISKSVAKCCTFTYGIMCLLVDGSVTKWGPEIGPNFETKPPTVSNYSPKIVGKIGAYHDIKCGPYSGAVMEPSGEWFSFSLMDSETPQYHLGHTAINGQLASCSLFSKPGMKLIDFSIGKRHSLVLMESVSTKEKELYVIGDNGDKVFGFETSKDFSKDLLKVELSPAIPLNNITRVKASEDNSYIGVWEDDSVSFCHGVPHYLSDVVCGGRKCHYGKCICKSDEENWDDVNTAYKIVYWIISSISSATREVIPSYRALPNVKDNWCVKTGDLAVQTSITVCEFFFWPMLFCSCGAFLTIAFFCCTAVPITVFLNCATPAFSVSCAGIVWVYLNREEKRKHELFQELLAKNDNSEESLIDMSAFNLQWIDFKGIEEIGSGGSGALCLKAIDKRNDEKVFIKLFSVKTINENEFDLKEFKNEVQHLTKLRHANVVTFYGVLFAPPQRVGYVCELCSLGSLHDFIRKLSKGQNEKIRGKFTLTKKINWMTQIAKGMRYLHHKEVIYRDLKPENVLIGNNEILKITDFGVSKSNYDPDQNMTKKAGTALYMAPEVVLGAKNDSRVDVFSFGIVMYEILFETVEPYGPNPPFSIELEVAQNPEYRPNTDISLFKPNETTQQNERPILMKLIEMMKKCWSENADLRPSFKDIVHDLEELTIELEDG